MRLVPKKSCVRASTGLLRTHTAISCRAPRRRADFGDLLFERDPPEVGPIPDGAPGNDKFEERADGPMLGLARPLSPAGALACRVGRSKSPAAGPVADRWRTSSAPPTLISFSSSRMTPADRGSPSRLGHAQGSAGAVRGHSRGRNGIASLFQDVARRRVLCHPVRIRSSTSPNRLPSLTNPYFVFSFLS